MAPVLFGYCTLFMRFLWPRSPPGRANPAHPRWRTEVPMAHPYVLVSALDLVSDSVLSAWYMLRCLNRGFRSRSGDNSQVR